jgi:CBS-domain-containing membrane protein
MPEALEGVNRTALGGTAWWYNHQSGDSDMSEQNNEERSRRDEADMIARRTSVREAVERVGVEPCIVPEGAGLLAVCERLGETLGVDTVVVVDETGRLTGVIPSRLLLDGLFLHVAPEEFLADLRAMEGVEEFGKLSRAHTARDLMQRPVYVTMDDSVREAFSRMHERRLEGLPVVDKEMRVVGYLDRLQLIRLWLRKHRGETGP